MRARRLSFSKADTSCPKMLSPTELKRKRGMPMRV
nr:MAG TPA: hypothetical protein [Caudoviricetes sp.]DAL39499.1 MAG TPA_asm: hypothetical protein [Caudoviricetes sp.]DAZ17788.1 MAG TPA: hypothetical protein [Caudoviricetes sp.]